jgi:hypothetical protein
MVTPAAMIYNVRQRPLLGAIEVNLSEREVYTLTATMPAHAIERGADITDHREKKPETFSIEGWISGATLRSQARVDENGNVVRQPVNGEGVVGLSIAEAYAQLQEVFNNKEPFDVVTNFRSYTNMHFTSFVVSRNAETSEVIAFSASLQEILFAESESATVRVVRSPKVDAPKTAPKKKPGAKSVKEVNQSTADKLGHKIAPGFVKDPVGKLNGFLNATDKFSLF